MKFRKVSALLLAGAMCEAKQDLTMLQRQQKMKKSQLLLLYGARQRTSQ